MLKNSKITLSDLNTSKCSPLFYNTNTLQQWDAKSIINFINFYITAATTKKINSGKTTIAANFLTIPSWFFFEPLEQFEIVDVFSDSKLLSLYAAIPLNYTVPLVFGGIFFIVLFANLPVYSNLFIANMLLFRLVKNLFSVNVFNSSKNQKSFFLFYAVFMFILYHNFCGMAPFTYTVTSLIITSFLLSTTVFFFVCVKSILQNGWFFFDHFLPEGVNIRGARWMVIIEIISFFTRVISLGVRLFANLLSGHILLKVLIGFFLIGITAFNDSGWLLLPGLLVYFIVLILVTSLEIFISFLQAYTFVFLAIIYFGETTKILESTSTTFKKKIVFFKPNLFSELKSFVSRKDSSVLLFLFFNAPRPKQSMFQEAGSHMMEEIVSFHNDIMCFLIFIVVAIVYLIASFTYYFHFKKNDPAVIEYMRKYNTTHNATLEIVWTALPTVVLLSIVLPSFVLLYISSGRLDGLRSPDVIKVVGHQWYWTYVYDYDIILDDFTDDDSYVFDSYLVAVDDLHFGAPRLLEATNSLVIPTHTKIRFVIISTDVIHSWAVPGLGIKVDACPGRINEVTVIAHRSGVYMGQCSEICGTNHGFMPIVVAAIDQYTFGRDLDLQPFEDYIVDEEEGALVSGYNHYAGDNTVVEPEEDNDYDNEEDIIVEFDNDEIEEEEEAVIDDANLIADSA